MIELRGEEMELLQVVIYVAVPIATFLVGHLGWLAKVSKVYALVRKGVEAFSDGKISYDEASEIAKTIKELLK